MKFLGYNKEELKDILFKTAIGTTILAVMVVTMYYGLYLGALIQEHAGTHLMVIYFFTPVWSPIAYLAGDTFIKWYRKPKT